MKKNIHHSFEEEVFYNITKQRNTWAAVALASICGIGLCISALIVMLPLKEIRPYVVMVNKTTGESEKIVEVRPAKLSEQEAVLQAELVSYISDRETFDRTDNERRINSALNRSKGDAATGLTRLWRAGNPDFPLTVYPKGVRVRVVVNSISLTPNRTEDGARVAIIRFTKTREEASRADIVKAFTATISYGFEPREEAKLEVVWHNPLGFTVYDYRIDAVTGGGGNAR